MLKLLGPFPRLVHPSVSITSSSTTKLHPKQALVGIWNSLLKGRISKECSKIWDKAMGPQLATSCERTIIKALWNHTYSLCIFCNNKDHKNDNRAVAEYKQKELYNNIVHLYSAFALNDLPINLLQCSHFDIQQEQLLLLSYDIRCA
jgi:hypothetical protein